MTDDFPVLDGEALFGGLILVNMHSAEACAGRPCTVHNRSEHHMRDWCLLWRNDRGMFERVCPHGIGHPDPDQREYWDETSQWGMDVHGCDGCCAR